MSMCGRSWVMAVAAAAVWVGAGGTSHGATYSYVDWTKADVAKGTAEGTITLPGGQTVLVTFAAINPDGMPGNLYQAQTTEGATNYWVPATPYMSAQVENAPPSTDILQLAGGQNQTYRVTLSEAIKDPVMAIVSLGAPGTTITYDFDAPFTIVSQGAGFWGGSDTALVKLPDDVLQGTEGHGTIQFIGTFATFSWTVPMPETWHGFNFAIRTTEALEPTPDAGAADGSSGLDATGVDAGTDAARLDAAADSGASGTDAGSDAKGKGKSDGCDCALGGDRAGAGSGLVPTTGLLAFALLQARRRRRR
jgi:hypothetical protein